MAELRGRRPRRRRKAFIEEVLPSTDLPPLVQGDLRCFLVVDVGKIIWSSTATAQVPPALPAYVRLRWWGETSEGTVFKPCHTKSKEKTRKCRCRFGVRSGAKQMSAYFVDMGSIMFELLTSPKSAPLGRIQIPKVAHLSSSNPVRDYYPIISPSSRKIGELEVHIRFKSLEAAYDITTDTGTDTSMSSRSMPPSESGRRSRSRGSSVGSKASARSRSSSAGKSGRRKRSGSKKQRRRSLSTESNASSASKRSQSIKKGSTAGSSTPRGIDDVLEKNGQDLFSIDQKFQKKSNLKSVERNEAESRTEVKENIPSVQQDAISILLQKGHRLRKDILKSQFEEHTHISKENSLPTPVDNVMQLPEAQRIPQAMPLKPPGHEEAQQISPYVACPKMVGPIKEKTQDLDMRFVDLVFGSQEFTGAGLPFWSEMDSHVGSPLSSMISDLDDNPLYDESLLQKMFYNNGGMYSLCGNSRIFRKGERSNVCDVTSSDSVESKEENQEKLSDNDRVIHHMTKHVSGLTKEKISFLHRVYGVSVTIESLSIHDISSNKARPKKGRGRGGKPPVPSPKKGKLGAYFVEYRFPDVNHVEKRDHPSSMTTSHDVTRVVSRKVQHSGGAIAIFDETSEFSFKFTDENLLKWGREQMEFIVYQRKATDKKACVLGLVKLQLRDLLAFDGDQCHLDLEVKEGNKYVGTLKIIFGFHIRPDRSVNVEDKIPDVQLENKQMNDGFEPAKTVTDVITDIGQHPSIALIPPATILNMMVMVPAGMNIRGTTVTNPQAGTKVYPPNVSLVCRTLSPGECDKTPVIWGQSNPKFDFVQVIPLKINDAMLVKMKNNFVIIEVWVKITATVPPTEKLLGLAKLPTHHFFQSLKDEEISKVILSSLHPLISVDEAVPVMDLFSGQERGHLQVTLALGTPTQIANLRKVKCEIQEKRTQHHHLEQQEREQRTENVSGLVQHTFEMNIIKLHNFQPPNNELWGEADCYVQYSFPTQQLVSTKDENLDANSLHADLASMESYRSEATLCIPDSAFNHTCHHKFAPPPSVPVQRILISCCYAKGMPGGIPFELWSRHYHPNVRDKLIAKGTLPMAKVGSLVSMSHARGSEQSFHIPMVFVDSDCSDRSAGNLEVVMKYKASGTTLEMLHPPMQFSKPVILRISLLRACGLKQAASLASRLGNNNCLENYTDVGVNTYVEIKPSFLPDQDVRRSQIVAMSFAPEYQHNLEIACPLISYHRDVTPISLAELMLSGEIEITVWHRSEDAEDNGRSDVALAKLNVPMRILLHKMTGIHGWHSLHAPEHGHDTKTAMIAGLEMSVAFANSNDLDLILKAAKATKWELPPYESRLLSNDVQDRDITGSDCVTFSVTVTNAWLPKTDLLLHGRTSIDKTANVYVRYKFFDHDSVVSTLCPLSSKQPHSIDARFENLTSARIAHKKSFVCKRSRPLRWYLREENMEVQVWLTHSISSKKSRPTDSDKLLGSCFLEFSSISEWQKEQHISGSFNLFKAGVDGLGGQVRVYVSMKLGEVTDPIPDPVQEKIITTEEDTPLKDYPVSEVSLPKPTSNELTFDATVTVERAFHLPLVKDLESDESIRPNVFVSFEAADEKSPPKTADEIKIVTVATRIVTSSDNVLWNEAKTVSLPNVLLSGSHGGMLLKVWHRDPLYLEPSYSKDSPQISLLATDRMLGFATIDLSVLRAGLRDINGWYNILDIHGQCQGQLKVAVTPTRHYDSSHPTSARSNDPATILPPSAPPPLASIPANFLHKVPIDLPVQTPSGSMYLPGVQTSVANGMKVCEDQPLMPTCPEIYIGRFQSDFSQTKNIPYAPTASMFRYVTSDRQQASLVNTLEKQIQELETIKQRFEVRKRARFQEDAEHNDGSHACKDTQTLSSESCETGVRGNGVKSQSTGVNHRDGENTSITGNHLIHSDNSRDSQKEVSEVTKPEQRTECDSAPQKSIHLSLYQLGKNPQLTDRVLSDNDVDSDVEFVQPQSLNESLELDGKTSANFSVMVLDKPPAAAQKNLNHHPELSNTVTSAKSEGHSALDDTSLWLTGSTSRVSGFSSDDDNCETGQKKDETSQSSNHEKESDGSDTPRSVVTPLVEETQSHNEPENIEVEITNNSMVCPIKTSMHVIPCEKNMDEADGLDAVSDVHSSREDSDSSMSLKSYSTVVEEPGNPVVSESTTPSLSYTLQENPDSDEKLSQQKQVNFKSEMADVCDGEQSGSKEEDSCEQSSDTSQNEENHCPNCASPIKKQNQTKACSSFYPPRKNVESSIRQLQEANLAHKDELVKKRSISVDSECKESHKSEKSSPLVVKPKSKRNIPKTVHYSDERTQRLARIFQTKFSSQ